MICFCEVISLSLGAEVYLQINNIIWLSFIFIFYILYLHVSTILKSVHLFHTFLAIWVHVASMLIDIEWTFFLFYRLLKELITVKFLPFETE